VRARRSLEQFVCKESNTTDNELCGEAKLQPAQTMELKLPDWGKTDKPSITAQSLTSLASCTFAQHMVPAFTLCLKPLARAHIEVWSAQNTSSAIF
jgi:hypothetical protein